MERFDNYTLADFLDDDSFLRFVKNGSANDIDAWQQWLATDPVNLNIYEDARVYLITYLSAKPIADEPLRKRELWQIIEQGINTEERRRGKVRRLIVWGASVAASVCLFVFGLWYFQSKVTVATAYGQQLAVTLPDKSVIQLNANSKLSYYRAWSWHKQREIWLSGEALFKVVHLNKNPDLVEPAERFFAHAGTVDVEVLGTTFNVKYRRQKILVVLINGSIRVHDVKSNGKPLMINPGDAVEYKNSRFAKRAATALANRPTAWTDRKMVATGMTVKDIIENYEDTYGGSIKLDNRQLLDKRIDGTISLGTKESTLYMLANILNTTVEQRGDTFYLKSK